MHQVAKWRTRSVHCTIAEVGTGHVGNENNTMPQMRMFCVLKNIDKSLPPENLLREIETNSNGFLYFCIQFKIKPCLVKFLLFSYVTMNGSRYTDTTIKFAESFGGNPPFNLSHHSIMKIGLINEIRLTWFLYKVSIIKLDLWLAKSLNQGTYCKDVIALFRIIFFSFNPDSYGKGSLSWPGHFILTLKNFPCFCFQLVKYFPVA